MSGILYSVVIPVYNRENVLSATLKSVLNQTLKDFEIIVVDDGSSDNPVNVINSLNDDRIRYIRQENAGGGAARNNGILNARGEYIALLDSDDFFTPKKLEVYAREFPLADNTVLYSSMKVDRGVDRHWIRPERGIGENEDVGEYLFCGNQLIQTSTIVLRREFAQKVLFDPALRRGQDLDFCVRLQREDAKFRFISEPLTIWSDNTEQGRTSYVSGYKASSEWLARTEHLLTRRSVYGYRATILAYHLAKVEPLTAFSDLCKGWLFGGVSIRIIIRQFIRAYMPRSFYRKLVNSFVKRFGRG